MEKSFQEVLEGIGEYGIVTQIKHHIAVISGLPHVKLSELVLFESGQFGQVFSIEEKFAEVLVFSRTSIKVGTRLTRLQTEIKVPVGSELLGRIIDPFGSPVVGVLGYKRPAEERFIDIEAPGIDRRVKIKRPFLTGVSIVDMSIPLGKGQRELIIGDRKTGKSSFLLNVIKNQVKDGSIAIYCAVGRKKSDIKRIEDVFVKEGIFANSLIVATSYDDPASSIFLCPYTAMTIAEYFRDSGKDVVLVIDDLTTHAKFYREISLLSRRFPGRDSYPGDIFYVHSKLLERAGNFKHSNAEAVSITCLPVAETFEDELSYITTNLMGMTDGHIFFDSNLYYKGVRPAINISFSVTRVGKQTQSPLMKEVNHELSLLLSSYNKMQSLSHFGGEVSQEVKDTLDTGNKIYKFFDQDYSIVVPLEIQLVLLSMIWLKFFYGESENEINNYRKNLILAMADESIKTMIKELLNVTSVVDLFSNVSKKKEEILSICKTGKK